jgi:acyl-coenzyme A synthetase/AMP-(fatty) acid ligase
MQEMEEALYLHPAVKQCVVMLIPDPPTDNDLFVFVTLQAALTGGEQELRDWVRHRVGDYTTLDRIVVLSQLPKVPSGKVDRRALRDLLLSFELGLDVVGS